LDSTQNGKRITGVPDVQANLRLEWGVPLVHGLTVNGNVVYTGSESANGASTTSIPASTRLDLGGRYGFTLAGELIPFAAASRM
jgi:iron complex outermembrane recepter protein